jgi:hypothetical protein
MKPHNARINRAEHAALNIIEANDDESHAIEASG